MVTHWPEPVQLRLSVSMTAKQNIEVYLVSEEQKKAPSWEMWHWLGLSFA